MNDNNKFYKCGVRGHVLYGNIPKFANKKKRKEKKMRRAS